MTHSLPVQRLGSLYRSELAELSKLLREGVSVQVVVLPRIHSPSGSEVSEEVEMQKKVRRRLKAASCNIYTFLITCDYALLWFIQYTRHTSVSAMTHASPHH